MKLINRYAPSFGRVVEAGCAHSALLCELKERGHDCIGIEPDEKTVEWVKKNTGLDIRVGFFPNVDVPKCDLFLAFDVLEHVHEPQVFMKSVMRLLNPGGIAIIQGPIDRYSHQPPFGKYFQRTFDDIEHLYVFTDETMKKLAEYSGLKVVDLTERLSIHHEIAVFKKA